MALAEVRDVVKVPQGVTATVKDGVVTIKGKNGELSRAFRHPLITLEKEGNDVVIHAEEPRKQTRALVGTFSSHLRNMVAGAQKDFEYKLKVVYAHFPIKSKVSGDVVVIENFLGEKTPRRARIMKGAKVKAGADEVVVTGPDVEAVSQTAANIEQACRIRGFDPRVFQDGIYITAKGA